MVISTIPPVENKLLGASFSADEIRLFNDEIRRIGDAKGARMVHTYQMFAGPDGFGRAGTTVDGVHLTAEFEKQWLDQLTTAVMQELKGCSQVPR